MTHYELLGVARDASPDAIRAGFEAQMNRSPSSTDAATQQRRQQIQGAYVVLSDPELRATYNERLIRQEVPLNQAPLAGGRIPTAAEVAAYDNQPAAVLARNSFEANNWAGFWIRYGAQVVDGLVMAIPVLLLSFGAGFLVGLGKTPPFSVAAFYLVEVVLFTLYSAWLNSSSHLGTLGRRAAGIAVVSESSGEQISFGRALARAVLSLFSALLIFPNLLQPFTPRRQSLADLIAGTVVVRKRPAGSFIIVAVIAFVFIGLAVIGMLAAIAIPAFQDYTVRARVTEGMAAGMDYELLVGSNAQDHVADLSKGFTPPAATLNVSKVDVSRAGVITVTMSRQSKDVTFSLYPSWESNGQPASTMQPSGDSVIKWTCRVADTKNDRYVPPECRI